MWSPLYIGSQYYNRLNEILKKTEAKSKVWFSQLRYAASGSILALLTKKKLHSDTSVYKSWFVD